MNAKTTIQNFETAIKQFKALFFDKVKERNEKGFKLIYNIQGLNYENTFFANLKFIFWLNKDMNSFQHNAITYLYKQNCQFKTIQLTDNLSSLIKTILNDVKNERTNNDINQFVIKGTDKFNEELKKRNIFDFIQSLEYKFQGNSSCLLSVFTFNLTTNDRIFEIKLKCSKDGGWILMYEDKHEEITFDVVYKKIIDLIYETNGNNI